MAHTGKPKPAFFLAVLAVIAALVAFSVYRCAGKKKTDKPKQTIDIKDIKDQSGTTPTGVAEDPNALDGITTAKEYSFEAQAKLPPVPGASDYKALGSGRVVKFAINVWAGWAPIIYANEGFSPKKLWKDAKGGTFKVELVLADNPIDMRNAFAAGETHIGWATVDMLPLMVEGLKADPRTMPRVFHQVDWSNGGDGIVVRESIKNIAGLKGKKVVLAQNSPSHYFLLNVLLNGGVQPSEVKMKFTKDAFQAAAAFNQNKDIAAVVSWAPDIYNLTMTGMGNTVANGTVHIGWATVDMLPLLVERLKRDPRTMPRVYQQIDWSNGGDGIVVHTDIKTIADLRDKTVVLAQNSPSHYFLLNALLNSGVQPSQVTMDFTQDAFQAAAAFNSEKKYAGVVTWAPDIYALKDVPGNKLLLSTRDANKLIADVWFARARTSRATTPTSSRAWSAGSSTRRTR